MSIVDLLSCLSIVSARFKTTPPPPHKIFPTIKVLLGSNFQGSVILVRNASSKNFSSIGLTRPDFQGFKASFGLQENRDNFVFTRDTEFGMDSNYSPCQSATFDQPEF